jgi:ubiquinone/menaquinone biosynthesis C-methylase UbiE
MNGIVARAPALWPLLRRPMRSYFERVAPGWGSRDRDAAEYLAPLAAGLLHVSPEPERALDIGTGTGGAALLVAREFPQARVRGVDLAEGMIEQAKRRIGLDPEGRVAFRVVDASELPWPDDSFDLVTMLNAPPFFSEIGRVLRPGGHAVIAASFGAATPFYTPESVLRRGFRRHGLDAVHTGEAGQGTYLVAQARLPQ